MANHYTCDIPECAVIGEPIYGGVPIGWLTVTKWAPTIQTRHFCSEAHAIKGLVVAPVPAEEVVGAPA